MEYGWIVFPADGVLVFSSALLLCKTGWRQGEARVRPAFVVIPLPVGDDASGLEQVLKLVDALSFLAQCAIRL